MGVLGMLLASFYLGKIIFHSVLLPTSDVNDYRIKRHLRTSGLLSTTENEKNAEDRVLTFPALNKLKQTASSVTSRAVDATFKLVREYIIISKQAKADEVFKANGLEKVMDDILLTHAKYTSWKNKVLSEYEYNDPAAFKAMYKTLIFKKDEARVLKIVQDGLKSETGSVVLLAEEMEEAMTKYCVESYLKTSQI